MIGVSAVIAIAVLFFAVLMVDTRAHGRRAVALLSAIRRELEVYHRPTPASAAGFRYMPGGDVATILFKGLAGGDTGSPGRAVIDGAREDLKTIADIAAASKDYGGPAPTAYDLSGTLYNLEARLECGLELLARETGGTPPTSPQSEPPPGDSGDDDGPPQAH